MVPAGKIHKWLGWPLGYFHILFRLDHVWKNNEAIRSIMFFCGGNDIFAIDTFKF